MFKKLSYLVLGILIILVAVMITRIYIGDKVSLLLDKKPTEIFLYDKNNVEYIIRQDDADDVISKIHDHISKKTAKRVADSKVEEFINNSTRIEYGYKGKTLFIDNQGRILYGIYKSEIRNKSVFHWVWWKIDRVIGDNHSEIFYLTEPDKEIIDIVQLIKELDGKFSEAEAIVDVLQEYKRIVEELEFPAKVGETKTVEMFVGGKPPGLIIPVELITNVEKIDDETYNVTLTKVWKDTKAGKDVVSYWTYKVAPKEIVLVKSQNNDGQFLLIK